MPRERGAHWLFWPEHLSHLALNFYLWLRQRHKQTGGWGTGIGWGELGIGATAAKGASWAEAVGDGEEEEEVRESRERLAQLPRACAHEPFKVWEWRGTPGVKYTPSEEQAFFRGPVGERGRKACMGGNTRASA